MDSILCILSWRPIFKIWFLSAYRTTLLVHLSTAFAVISAHHDDVPGMTPWNGNIFRVAGHLCGELTGHWWIPHTKASDGDFDVFFDLRLNELLSKQSWGWWFETPSHPLWRHSNVVWPDTWIKGITGALQMLQETACRCVHYWWLNVQCCVVIEYFDPTSHRATKCIFSLCYLSYSPTPNNQLKTKFQCLLHRQLPLYPTIFQYFPREICPTENCLITTAFVSGYVFEFCMICT